MKKYNDIEHYAKIYKDTFLTESYEVSDIRDSDIDEKMQLVLETPGGSTLLNLDGDWDTNQWLVDLIQVALNDKARRNPGQYASVAFYVNKHDNMHFDRD